MAYSNLARCAQGGYHDGRCRVGSLGSRVLRAVRLDTRLYREVAAQDCTRQAALIVLIAALVSALDRRSLVLIGRVNSGTAPRTSLAEVLEQQNLIPMVGVFTLALLVAWPVWAAGLWMVGSRLSRPDAAPTRCGQVARAIAFAQTPAIVGILIPVLVAVFAVVQGPEAFARSGSSFLRILASTVNTLTGIWVVVGTYLAVRESLRLSDIRALGSLVLVAVSLTLFLSIIVAAVVFAGGFSSRDAPLGLAGLSTFDVMSALSNGFDFNLYLGLVRSFTSATASTVLEAIN